MEGHFLVNIECSSCQRETFNFEAFGELALDLVNLEQSRLNRQKMKKKFDDMKNRRNWPDFQRGLSHQFDIPHAFDGLLSTSNRGDSRSSLNSADPKKFELLREDSSESARSKDSNSLLSGNIHSFNSSTSSQKNSSRTDNLAQLAYDRFDMESEGDIRRNPGLAFAGARRQEAFPDVYLEELIREFFEEDYIDDYACGHCGKRSMIKKQYQILQEPEVMRVTLKRFVSFPRMCKIRRPIFIEKEEFDFKPYLYKYDNICKSLINIEESLFESKAERRNLSVSYNNPESFNRSISLRKVEYEMASYIEHSGTLHKGHYVAFVKEMNAEGGRKCGEDQWMVKNDDKVYLVQNHSRKLVLYNQAVYSFFFKKKKHSF